MKIIDIFWTGGLDSTYRILELILIRKKKTQPHYIIDSSRPSTFYEMQAMEKIRSLLNTKAPDARELLLPINLTHKADIKENKEITGWYENLQNRLRIGIQYEWLSRFAHENSLKEIELCFVRHPEGRESDLFKAISSSIQGTGHDCRFESFKNPDLKLFKNFRLPTFHLTKLELRNRSSEYGFQDLLNLTWFCHTPTKNGSVCGLCRPCQYVRDSGFGSEFRFNSDLFHNRIKRKVKEIARALYRAFNPN